MTSQALGRSNRLWRRFTAGFVLLCCAAAPPRTTTQSQPTSRLPRQMSLRQLLDFAERVVQDARKRRDDPTLRPIERIALATGVASRLSQAYGKMIWFDGTVRRLVDRGEVRFEAPPTATTATRPVDVRLPIVDVLVETDAGNLAVIQMTRERAARIELGKPLHFTARLIRFRRTGPRQWNIWLRHSRIPRRLDRWTPTGGFPDYRGRSADVVGSSEAVTRKNVAVP